MPIYEYNCPECGASRDERRPIRVRDLPAFCHKCSGRMKRRVGGGSLRFRFKPRGWKPYTLERATGPESIEDELCYATDE
jgi:putative FmdB family regulatory protein